MTQTKKEKVFGKYNGHCAYCGCTLTRANRTVDHIKPQSKGGANDINNLMPACRSCNLAKGNKNIEHLRIVLAWPTLTITDMATYDGAMKAAKRYKFYFEKQKKHKINN